MPPPSCGTASSRAAQPRVAEARLHVVQAERLPGPLGFDGDLDLAVDHLIGAGRVREGGEREVAIQAQGDLAVVHPRASDLADEPQRFTLPAPGDLAKADDVGGEAAVERDLVELLPAAHGVDAERAQLPGHLEVASHGPGRDVGARDLEVHAGLRHADHDVAARDPDPTDADAYGTRLERLRERKERGAAPGRGGNREVQVEVGGDGGDGELPAPQARDVDAHVDGPSPDQHAGRRRGAGADLQMIQRDAPEQGPEAYGAQPCRLPQRLRQQGLDALAGERGAVESHDCPGRHEGNAHHAQHGEQHSVPPAESSSDPHRVASISRSRHGSPSALAPTRSVRPSSHGRPLSVGRPRRPNGAMVRSAEGRR